MNKNRIMTLEEVASYLRISERTVKDWVTKGKLPGGKLGTNWRFQRSEIENWVNQKLSPKPTNITNQDKSLISLISEERILFLDTNSKEETLNKLIDVSYKLPGILNREELADAVFKREELMSTGIGLGIGVPHVRLDNIKDLQISIAINKNEIKDYVSLDEIPIKIVILIIAVRDQHLQYIKILSKIAKLMKNSDIREQLVNTTNAKQVIEILSKGENL